VVPDRCIDLNADVGEATTTDGIAVERALLDIVTSVHVACGGHAGDQASMRATVAATMAAGVRVGAHPSYPDRAGFGRRRVDLEPAQLHASLTEQLDALVDVCASLGASVASVKAHGALYGEVARGDAAYDVFLGAVEATCAPGTTLVLPAGSPAVHRARTAARAVSEEGFCDRTYAPSGGLVDRHEEGAVHRHPSEAAGQALALVRHGRVRTSDGALLDLHVDTLCVHGDSPGAVAMAAAVRQVLEANGVRITTGPTTA
jgi:UPF0271 protein